MKKLVEYIAQSLVDDPAKMTTQEIQQLVKVLSCLLDGPIDRVS